MKFEYERRKDKPVENGRKRRRKDPDESRVPHERLIRYRRIRRILIEVHKIPPFHVGLVEAAFQVQAF